MSVPAAVRVVMLLALTRILGGAWLIHALGAPGWAVAVWLIAHTRVRVGPLRDADSASRPPR